MNCRMLYFLMMIYLGYGISNLFGMEEAVLPEQTAEVPGHPLLPGDFEQLPPDVQRQIVEALPLEALGRLARTSRASSHVAHALIVSDEIKIMAIFNRMRFNTVGTLVGAVLKGLSLLNPEERKTVVERFMANYASTLGKSIFSQNLERDSIQRGGELVLGHNYTTVYFDGSTTVSFFSADGIVIIPSREISRSRVDCKNMSFDNFINWFKNKMLTSPYQKSKFLFGSR